MTFTDYLFPKLFCSIDFNFLSLRLIGSDVTLSTKTHVHLLDNKIVEIGETISDNSENFIVKDGFGHKRVLIGDFDIAEQVLKYSFKRMLKHSLFFRPIAVINIKRHLEGGISQVEKHSVVDVFESAGARQIYFWNGDLPSEKELMDWTYIKHSIFKQEKQSELSQV